MDDCLFLKCIFDGYCNLYRTFNLSTRASWTDFTQAELSHFYQLGEMLGYLSEREEGLRDLSWHELDSGFKTNEELILYLERETWSNRALITARKLFNERKKVKYLVCILGWVEPKTFEQLVQEIDERIKLEPRHFLLIAWEGVNNPNNINKVHGRIWCNGKVFSREAKPKLDEENRYWNISLKEQSWQQL